MAQVYVEPKQVALAAGETAKFRLKNPLKEKFIYGMTMSEKTSYLIDIPPFGVVPMGENVQISVSRNANTPSAGVCQIGFKIFKHTPVFPMIEGEKDLGAVLQQFTLEITPK